MYDKLRAKVMEHYDEWQDDQGYGPCGEVACVLRERGLGRIALVMVKQSTPSGLYDTPHYVILEDDGQIIDVSLPWDADDWTVEDILDADEYPELATADTIEWWRQRI